jgi:hypothetical protein
MLGRGIFKKIYIELAPEGDPEKSTAKSLIDEQLEKTR